MSSLVKHPLLRNLNLPPAMLTLLSRILEVNYKLGAKYLLGLVLLLNIRAFPFVWHFRVFRPVYRIWLGVLSVRLKSALLLRSPSQKHQAIEAYFHGRSPVGVNLLNHITIFRSFASIDESDYNLHLSNSSYAKALDGARFKAACDLFPHFLRAGGRIALAGTSFSFLKEIPILAPYEVRVSVQGWDSKWMYVVCKFVTKNKKSSTKKTAPSPPSTSFINDTSPGISIAPTPLPNPNPNSASTNLASVDAKLSSVDKEVEEGYTLHTVSISQLCFKVGRITVPPAVVFATNGMTSQASSSASALPKTYEKVREILSQRDGLKKLREVYKGGWRESPWVEFVEEAFRDIEEQRKERTGVLSGAKSALEGARLL